MTDQNNQIQNVPQASQGIIDAAKRESHQWLNPETWRTMQMIAQTFVQSGAMPKSMDTAPKVIVALQAGKEAGLQPLEAVNSFYFVNGKVSMYGEMAIAQVLKAGHIIEWGKCDAETATVKIIRGDNNKMSNEVTFTMKMAQERGLTSNPVYKKYPENMLRFKAFHACAKFIVSDALHGVPIKEVEEAEYIEEVRDVTAHPDSKPKHVNNVDKQTEQPKQDTSLEDAINKPEKADKKQIKEIIDLAIDKGKDVLNISAHYGCPDIESLTVDQAKAAIAILKKAPKVVVEEMPAEPKKESKAAKTMREAKEKLTKKAVAEKNAAWPEDVCRYLRFVDGINDEDLPKDIIELKKDAISGEFKGYGYYPSLKSQIETLPEEFK